MSKRPAGEVWQDSAGRWRDWRGRFARGPAAAKMAAPKVAPPVVKPGTTITAGVAAAKLAPKSRAAARMMGARPAVPKPPASLQDRAAAALTERTALESVPVQLRGSRLVGYPDDDPADLTATRRALLDYRGALYLSTNAVLRHPPAQPDKWDRLALDRVAAIDRAMRASPLPKDVIVWRGQKSGESLFGPRPWPADLTGHQWREPAYASTSTDQSIGRKFADRVLLRILLPAGTPAVRLSAAGRGPTQESEILLGRGTRFRVTADRTAGGVRELDVEVIP